jgi:hypothetical protein
MISRPIGAVVLSLHKSIVILSESASSLAKKQRVEGPLLFHSLSLRRNVPWEHFVL